MTDEFLGRGWRFPVGTDHRDDVALVEGEQDIEQAIEIIVGTAKGERVMRPEFGCRIHDHVFSSVNATTINLIENAVRDALVEWEPRIDLEGVTAKRDDRNPNRLLIDIKYRVRSTNSTSNMVYPFYLEER